MAANRETRRRRIVERGSDRLALITGRIQTLPQSAPGPLDGDSGLPASQPYANHQITSLVSFDEEGKLSDPLSMKQASVSDSSQSDACDVGRNLGSSIHESEGKDQMLKPLDLINRAALSSSSISPTLEGSRDAAVSNLYIHATRTEERPRSQTLGFMPFSSTQLCSAIVASQMTRLLCSIVVAVIVVLSNHVGFPLLGSKLMKSTIISRPVYSILFTNITIVIARLLYKKQADTDRFARRENDSLQDDGNDWATQVGMTLEAGLVMQSVADAVFMDFGVYAVTIVCGLSLVETVGRILLV